MKRTKKACCILFIVILFLPMIQRLTKFAPGVTLAGVVAGAADPEVSIGDWFNGKYQRAQEDYFNERFGFRPYLVKTYNQINFNVFRRIPGRRGTQIVIGRDNWLYELEYIQRYVRPGRAEEDQLEELVQAVRKLQDALLERGAAFVLVISPSKVEIYPERVPEEHFAGLEEDRRVTDYSKLVPLLDKHGVRYVDSHRLFLELKKDAPYPLFAVGGTHWNHYSIFFVLEKILDLVSPLPSGLELPVPVLESVVLRPPKGADRDLADLMNLWYSAEIEVPTPYAVTTAPYRPYEERPDVLIIGDSFTFTIIDALRAGKTAGKIDFLYYFKRHFDYPTGDDEIDHGRIEQIPLDHQSIDWDGLLLSKEIVILEVNEIFSGRLGWGFPQAACAVLQNEEAGQ